MEDYQFKGQYKNDHSKIDVVLSLFSFDEDDNIIIYSPALDISGYGKGLSEAKKSFETALDEFIRYTLNKDTFRKVLKELGWEVPKSKKSKKKYIPPELTEMFKANDYLNQIFNDKEFHKYQECISLPA